MSITVFGYMLYIPLVISLGTQPFLYPLAFNVVVLDMATDPPPFKTGSLSIGSAPFVV
jgi:hypothetical protein